jgi:transposase
VPPGGPTPAASATPICATPIALKSLARRILELNDEVANLDQLSTTLVGELAPQLVAAVGIGGETAGQLLVTAGDNPERLGSEAAFAMLCAAALLPASSGKTQRHRLNRGGDRQANSALHLIVVARMGVDQPTKAYVARRIAQGHSKLEIICCLKRYVAREIPYLPKPPTQANMKSRAA